MSTFPVRQNSVEISYSIISQGSEFGVNRLKDEQPLQLRLGQVVIGENRVELFLRLGHGRGQFLGLVPRRECGVRVLEEGSDLKQQTMRAKEAFFSSGATRVLKQTQRQF